MTSAEIGEFKNERCDIDSLNTILLGLYNNRCDKLAERLLGRFGSFRSIFFATAEELLSVEGMTQRAAIFFLTSRPAYRQALIRAAGSARVDSEHTLVRCLVAYFMNEQSPVEYALLLDKHDMPLKMMLITSERLRCIVGGACRYGAEKLILVRYRPFAVGLKPDAARISDIFDVIYPLDVLGIGLVDCVEYTPFRFYSMRRAVLRGEDEASVSDSRPTRYENIGFSRRLEDYILNRHSLPLKKLKTREENKNVGTN